MSQCNQRAVAIGQLSARGSAHLELRVVPILGQTQELLWRRQLLPHVTATKIESRRCVAEEETLLECDADRNRVHSGRVANDTLVGFLSRLLQIIDAKGR